MTVSRIGMIIFLICLAQTCNLQVVHEGKKNPGTRRIFIEAISNKPVQQGNQQFSEFRREIVTDENNNDIIGGLGDNISNATGKTVQKLQELSKELDSQNQLGGKNPEDAVNKSDQVLSETSDKENKKPSTWNNLRWHVLREDGTIELFAGARQNFQAQLGQDPNNPSDTSGVKNDRENVQSLQSNNSSVEFVTPVNPQPHPKAPHDVTGLGKITIALEANNDIPQGVVGTIPTAGQFKLENTIKMKATVTTIASADTKDYTPKQIVTKMNFESRRSFAGTVGDIYEHRIFSVTAENDSGGPQTLIEDGTASNPKLFTRPQGNLPNGDIEFKIEQKPAKAKRSKLPKYFHLVENHQNAQFNRGTIIAYTGEASVIVNAGLRANFTQGKNGMVWGKLLIWIGGSKPAPTPLVPFIPKPPQTGAGQPDVPVTGEGELAVGDGYGVADLTENKAVRW